MGSLWEDLKETVRKGISTVAVKGEEYGKIGRVKLDIMNLKKQMDQAFRELGVKAYDHAKAKTKSRLEQDEFFQDKVAEIDALKKKVDEKEAEIAKIKEEAVVKGRKKETGEDSTSNTEETPS